MEPDKITMSINWKTMFDAEHELTSKQREEIKVLREALEAAAGALDSGLNCGDADAACQDMDDALIQARAALKVSP